MSIEDWLLIVIVSTTHADGCVTTRDEVAVMESQAECLRHKEWWDQPAHPDNPRYLARCSLRWEYLWERMWSPVSPTHPHTTPTTHGGSGT